MVGLIPFTTPVFAIIIVTIMYFGIKIYVEKRKQSIRNDVGGGICMECGSVISDEKCPNCDYSKE